MPRPSRTSLWIAFAAVCLGVNAARADFDSRRARLAQKRLDRALEDAREEQQEAIVDAQEGYDRALEGAQKEVMRGGDLDEARRIDEVRSWLEGALRDTRRGELGRTSVDDHRELTAPAAVRAQRRYREAVEAARVSFREAKSEALRDYADRLQDALERVMRRGDLPEAERIDGAIKRSQAELDALRAAESWVVVFRSRDPKDWDTFCNEETRYAIPLDSAPADMRYVRLRRMDTEEFVVLALDRDGLGRDATSGPFGWQGAKTFNEGGYHLGVDNAAWKLTFRDGGRIMVSNARSTAGWGFGHKVHANDVQYWSWAGQEIPPVVFEVAVTSRDLTDEERAHLLEEGSGD